MCACRQEKAAKEQQVAAGEHELTSRQVVMPPEEPQATDPEDGAGEPANLERYRLGKTEAARNALLHDALEHREEMEADHRSKEEYKLARIMKAVLHTWLWMRCDGSSKWPEEEPKVPWRPIDRLDAEVQELTEYDSGADQDEIGKQAAAIVLEFQEVLRQKRGVKEQQKAAAGAWEH
jgi:hypothetical protein